MVSDILEVLKSSKFIRILYLKSIEKQRFEAPGKGGRESLKCHLPVRGVSVIVIIDSSSSSVVVR